VIKILLVRLRQIGDVVFTTPMLRALRERFPDAHLSYVVEPAAAPVVSGNHLIDEVIVAPRVRGVHGVIADWSLGRRLRRAGYDIVIDFHGGPRASILTWLSGAPDRIGYAVIGRAWMYTRVIARPRALRPRHSVENQWDLLVPLGCAAPSAERYPVEMPLEEGADAAVTARLSTAGALADDRLIVIHVSAGNPFRRWPLTSFGAVAAALTSADPRRRIIVTSGPSESEAAEQVAMDARRRLASGDQRDRVVAWGDEFSLSELRALVARAVLYVGGDSGPMHVASTSRVPMVSIYGPTLPARSAPWRDANIPSIVVETVGLACRPCDQRRCVPGDFRCLARIEPQQVIAAAEQALTQTGYTGGLDRR
jgi:lipopolysaccharide heptosyltransferase II